MATSTTLSLREVADQAVTQALSAAFTNVLAAAVTRHPKSRVKTTLRAYLDAARARLDWMESRAPF